MRHPIVMAAPCFGAFSETFIYRQVTGMQRLLPTVFTDERRNKDPFPAPGIRVHAQYGEEKPKSVRRRRKWRRRLFLNPWTWPRATAEHFARVCRESEARAAIAQYGTTALSALPISRELGIPLVVHFHGFDASSALRDRSYLSLIREAAAHFAGVIAPSRYLLGCLADAGCVVTNPVVIGYGVDIPDVQDRCPGGSTRFLHVGRAVAKKGLVYSVRAFALARRELKEATFDVVGEGSQKVVAAALASELGVGDDVTFHGAAPHERVQALMQRSDVLIQHSVTAPNGDMEGLPVSILEAQANGLPVVATRHSGIPEEVLEGETALLVDERDFRGMAKCMVQLGLDPERRLVMGRAGRRHMAQNFELGGQIAKLEDYCCEVIGEGGQPLH